MPASETVEERLEKARLLQRTTQEVINMAKSVDQLLHAQHISNLAQAVVCVQELARDHAAVVIALKWVVLLVDLLEADRQDARLAACNALAAVSMTQEGRDAVRSSGGLRPLVMLLAEGSRSTLAAAAAAALMNCSACDTCKEAIADCRGVPQLLALIRDAVSRCNLAANEGRNAGGGGRDSTAAAAAAAATVGEAEAAGGEVLVQDLRSPGECKAALYAAGALMNMGGVISVQEKLLAAGAVHLFENVLRISPPTDVVATRANFMLSWLAVASGATAAASGSVSEQRGPPPRLSQYPQPRKRSGHEEIGSGASTPRSVDPFQLRQRSGTTIGTPVTTPRGDKQPQSSQQQQQQQQQAEEPQPPQPPQQQQPQPKKRGGTSSPAKPSPREGGLGSSSKPRSAGVKGATGRA